MSNSGVSDYNLREITTKDFSEILRTTIEYGCADDGAPAAVFVAGRRGSGKTFIAKDAIKDSGCDELYLNLSMCERTEISGFPNLLSANKGLKYVSYMLPQYFEPLFEGDKPVVALFDEIDKCQSDLFGSLLEIFQFKSVNSLRMKNLRAIICTGNLQQEGGHRPALPLLDRTEKYLMTTRVDHWLDWCSSKNARIHPSITAFISDHPDLLMGEVDNGDLYADPSPRGWHNYSKILAFGEERKWSVNTLIHKAFGCIGKAAGIRYEAYFTHYQVLLPIAEKIMKGENVAEFEDLHPSKKMVACMIVCSRLSRLFDVMHEKKEKLPPQSKTVVKFLRDVDPEMALTSIRGQIGIDRVIKADLLQEKHWDDLIGGMVKKVNGVP